MTLYETIMEAYPELTKENFMFDIVLRNDADGEGDYIEQWNYSKPLPKGMKIGK
jgi:hypothetical protein